jgi:hypothetical protein
MEEDSTELIRSRSQTILVHFLSADLELAGKLLEESARSLNPRYIEAAIENARASLNIARRLTWRIEEPGHQREVHLRIHELHAVLTRYVA